MKKIFLLIYFILSIALIVIGLNGDSGFFAAGFLGIGICISNISFNKSKEN